MASVLGRSFVGGAGWVAGWLAGGELVALDWFEGVRNVPRSALDVIFFPWSNVAKLFLVALGCRVDRAGALYLHIKGCASSPFLIVVSA